MTTTRTTPISVHGLTKQSGRIRALEALTFEVRPGQITGFLGPNGAGKTTTLRTLLGLARLTAGAALIGGRPYPWLPHPRRTVGAVLEATGAHPGRHARDQLRILAQVTGVPDGRVAEICDQVGLTEPADRRMGGYSLGMRQRLGLAGRCSATRQCCCSTNRPTGWTRPAWPGYAACCVTWPTRAAPSWSPATTSARSPKPSTRW
jgi:ABC-type multidrug transport system ATPase subunit